MSSELPASVVRLDAVRDALAAAGLHELAMDAEILRLKVSIEILKREHGRA